MKKILSILLTFSILIGSVTVTNAAYTDVESTADYRLSALRLQDLEIISGYDDGSFRPNNTITRAEFTKIVVCMMGKEDDAKASNATSGFFDISLGSWYTPYINYAVSQGILSGYADGSFAPNNTITFAEAITILLRTLGYNEENVGYFWPNNYVNVAATLGVSSEIYCNPNDIITRATAAILVDRSLFTKPCNSSSNDTYLETVGYTVLEDALILNNDTKSDNVTVLSGNMKQNNATTYLEKTQLPLSSGDIYNYAVIDKNGYFRTVREYYRESNICSVTGAVNKLTDNTIEYTTVDGLKSSFLADDNFIIYNDGIKMNFETGKNKISSGIDITFYGNNYGLWNIAVIGGSDDIAPVLASKNYTNFDTQLGNQTINTTNLIVYRNGEYATLSDIKAGDVVYYNTKTNVMDVYSKKVTGTYYSAYPSKAYVESVTVAGKSYEIGYSSATSRLDASEGAFNIGDKITLILGKNDKVVFVSDSTSSFDYYSYGVVLSSEIKTATEGKNEGNSEYVTTLYMADGEAHEIVTNKLYNNNIGDMMFITYTDGAASLQKKSDTSKTDFVGEVNLKNRTINGNYFLKDGVIIQKTSDSTDTNANCELISFENLTSTSLTEKQIINVITTNGFNDIAILYVQNFESTDNFGIISGVTKQKMGTETITTAYSIFSNGTEHTYNKGTLATSAALGEGIAFKANGSTLSTLTSLLKLTSGVISTVDGSRIKIGKNIYKIADNVQIFEKTSNTNIRSISIDELINTGSASATLYSDKSATNGGLVRVITINK